MKNHLLSKIVMLLAAVFGFYIVQGQIISQYIETNSGTTPKGIEIWNTTGSTLDFSTNNLVIEKGTNGGTPSTDYTLSSGTLDDGEVIVIGTSDLETTTTGNGADFYEKAFTFNGDDALVVKYGGTITDVFGEPGVDPGSEWEGNGVSTKNQNIELKAGITTGDTDGWSDPSVRFQTVNTDPSGTDGDEGFGLAPAAAGSPYITASPVSLSGFSYLFGSGPSSEQSFSVEGGDLTNDIIITAPSSYEISETSGSGYTSPITLTQSGGTVGETTIYVRLKASLSAGDYDEDINISSTDADSKTVSCNGSVEAPATTTIPYSETFDSDLGDCYTYSVSGDTKEWYWNSGGYAAANGFNSGDTEEDWLIIPGIDLDSYFNETMTFDTYYQYGTDDENNYLKLMYSADYSGVGDPTGSTWTELSYNQPGSSATWTTSGPVDLSVLSGSSVYIGFKYRYESGSYRAWRVDNISIVEGVPPLDADFEADQTTVIPGTTINFSDMTTGGTTPYSYEWDLDGDGEFDDSTAPDPTFTYNTAGTYDIGLKVTDSDAGPNVDQEIKTEYITVVNVATNVVINEIDTDTPGSDEAEFIELFDGGTGNTDLSGLVVVLYNGSDDKSYLPAIDLDGYSTDVNGYFVIGSTDMGTDIEIDPGSSGWLQNGADAVALHIGSSDDYPNDTPVSSDNLLDAIVYDTDDSDDAGLVDVLLNPGQPQVNENGRGDKANHSCQRIPNGTGGQRNTDTYDQSPPTISSENILAYTDWTGTVSDDWDADGNWTNGVPDATIGVTIPDVSGKANFPSIWNPGAECNELSIESGGTLYVGTAGTLTTYGHFGNNGTINLDSDGSDLIATFIDKDGISGSGIFGMIRYVSDDAPAYHLISPPNNSTVSGDFWGYYLYDWNETINLWEDVDVEEPWDEPLIPMKGYNIHPSAGSGYSTEIEFYGEFNSGIFTNVMSHSNYASDVDLDNWNLLGNPYPSSIDYQDMYDAGTYLATNQEPSVYYYDNASAQYASYNPVTGIGTDGGTEIIPANQGFFIRTDASGPDADMTMTIDNAVRTHDDVAFYKSDPENLVRLEAHGNGYVSETAVYFIDEATPMVDDYDSRKLFASVAEVPSLFSYADGNSLSLNSQPQTNFVELGFKAGVNGGYTIKSTNTSDFGYLVLQDIVTGVMTNIINDDYTFVYDTEDIENRFVLHFATVNIDEKKDDNVSVYSLDNKIYITSMIDQGGDVYVYNLMGQEISRLNLSLGLNTVSMDDFHGYCIVKVKTNNNIVTSKILIK